MNITVNLRNTTIVKPAEETPRESLWLSNVDLVRSNVHVPSVYFFSRPGPTGSLSEAGGALRDALAKILVPFYPLAGRLRLDASGRQEVDCNAEGVMFVEAETDAAIADFGDDFTPNSQMMKLIPTVDRSGHLSSFPLFLAQITFFKCGGVTLGAAIEHRLADGLSGPTFINLWSEVTRGLNPKTLHPLLDRTFLRAREPPQPAFDHIEYKPPPTLEDHNDQVNVTTVTRSFRIEAGLINALKEKSKENGTTTNYSTFVTLVGHIWKCACKARALSDIQMSKLFFATSGRARLQPPTPPNFFGNVIFSPPAMAKVGDLVSKPVWYAYSIIHNSLELMDNKYLRSAIDFLELLPNLVGLVSEGFGSPNLGVTSWVRLPFYDADFGWGRPSFVGPADIPFEGKLCIYQASGDENDKTLLVAITLQSEVMKEFEKLLYEI